MHIIKIIFVIIVFYPVCLYSKSIWEKPAGIGYWFYKNTIIYNITNRKINNIQKSKCFNNSSWSVSCGFVDPTKLGLNKEQAFLFEQKEYKELLRNFSMYSNNYTAVLQWQKFNNWVLNQAMAASYSSEFNIAQNPELDSAISHPFSQFANLIIKNMENTKKQNFFNMLAKTSLLVFFTRSNCSFCHYQADIVHILEEETHIPVWNASLDTGHLPGFNRYLLLPDTLRPAQYLHVSTVPTLFLYLAPASKTGSQEHWIRLATGLTSADVIENRILRFVQDYRRALIQNSKDLYRHPKQNW